jgi:hypothetical protein
MHLYGVQMACCSVEIQELVASVVVSLVVKYIGHIVSKDGIEHDPNKIEKVTNWPHHTRQKKFDNFSGS